MFGSSRYRGLRNFEQADDSKRFLTAMCTAHNPRSESELFSISNCRLSNGVQQTRCLNLKRVPTLYAFPTLVAYVSPAT